MSDVAIWRRCDAARIQMVIIENLNTVEEDLRVGKIFFLTGTIGAEASFHLCYLFNNHL